MEPEERSESRGASCSSLGLRKQNELVQHSELLMLEKKSMGSLTDITEDESAKKVQDTPYVSWTPKDIRINKTQNYLITTKKARTILMQLAFSMGLSSMWRFPYLCHRNGGGSFILLYFLMLILLGVPLMYMEMIIGQWLHVDNIQAWKLIVPWLGGIGYTSTLVCMLVSLYNSAIPSWSLFYLIKSFNYPMPWDYCPLVKNISATDVSCLQTVPHQYFWYHTTLQASGHIEEGIQALVLTLSLGLLATWLFVFLTIIIKMKILMLRLIFSIILPYTLFLCLFIRGLFLEGSVASLRRMVTIELSTLASMDLWRQAGGHVLYSLGLGLGPIITFSSYEAQSDNFVKVTSFVALGNLVTSMLTTAIIFLVLGFWTTTSGHPCVKKTVSKLTQLIDKGVLPQEARPPENILLLPPLDYLDWIIQLPRHLQFQVIRLSMSCSIRVQSEKFMEGPGLAYAAFSQVVSSLPGASFWTIIFFLNLLITGIGTLLTVLENIVFSLQNSVSIFMKYSWLAPVVICLGGLLGSLIFTSRAGSYVLSLFDDHLVPLTLIVIVIFQNVTLAWIYGANRFKEQMFRNLGPLLCPSFVFLWCYVTLPILVALLTICIMSLHNKDPPYYIAWNSSSSQEVRQPYPKSAMGWIVFLSILTLLPILGYPLHHWWYYQDPIFDDTLDKPLSFKKTTLMPPKPLQWPKKPTGKSDFSSRDRFTVSSNSSQGVNLSLRKDSSWFGLPRYS